MSDIRCGNCKEHATCVNAYEGPPNYWCSNCGSVGPIDDGSWDEPAMVAELRSAVAELLPYLTKEQREHGNKDLFDRAKRLLSGGRS